MKDRKLSPARFVIGAFIVFFAGAFILPAALQSQDTRFYMLAAVIPGALLLSGSKRFARLLMQDRFLFVITLIFCGLSILIQLQINTETGITLAFLCGGALLLMLAGSLWVRMIHSSVVFALFPAVPAITLLILPLCMDVGPFRPGFIAAALLMTAFVVLLSARKQILAVLLALAGTLLLLAQGDLTAAVVWSVTFLLLFWACSGHPVLLLAGAGSVVLSVYFAGLLVPGFFSPDELTSVLNAVRPGWFGLEWSDPFFATAAPSETSVFVWIAIRYGWVFAVSILLLCLLLVMRISALAHASRHRMHGLLAMGAALLTGLVSVTALLSDFGIWPACGFSLPAMTNDPVSLYTYLFLIGLAGGVSVRNQADLENDEHLATLAD